MADKIFLKCTARLKTFSNGGSLIHIGVTGDALRAFIDEHENERGYLNLSIQSRREIGPYGDTHSVSLDTWEPKGNGGEKPVAPITESDIPF